MLATMHHARATLREQGYRLTPQRNLIWEVLRDAGRHMTAEEVAAEVRRTLPDVNVSTVYRTLDLLVSLDLVVETRLEGSVCHYEVSPEPTHHHFVCTRCGLIRDLCSPTLDAIRAPEETSAFGRVESVDVQLRGVCAECQRKEDYCER